MNMPDQQYADAPEAAENQAGDFAEQQDVANPETEQHEADHIEGDEKQVEQKQASDVEKINRAHQRRVDRLTRENATAAAERDMYRRQLEDLQSRGQSGDEGTKSSQPDPQVIARQAVEAERFNARCNDLYSTGLKELPDFQSVIASVHEEAPLADEMGQPSTLMQSIVDTDHPHKVLHYLSRNPELAAELADMTPIRQARRLGQIERDMEKPKATSSAAPKPLQTVKPTASKAEPSPEDTERWIAARNRQQFGR